VEVLTWRTCKFFAESATALSGFREINQRSFPFWPLAPLFPRNRVIVAKTQRQSVAKKQRLPFSRKEKAIEGQGSSLRLKKDGESY
jgi:hypothetical protein